MNIWRDKELCLTFTELFCAKLSACDTILIKMFLKNDSWKLLIRAQSITYDFPHSHWYKIRKIHTYSFMYSNIILLRVFSSQDPLVYILLHFLDEIYQIYFLLLWRKLFLELITCYHLFNFSAISSRSE